MLEGQKSTPYPDYLRHTEESSASFAAWCRMVECPLFMSTVIFVHRRSAVLIDANPWFMIQLQAKSLTAFQLTRQTR
jgi:hypothetical protein